MSKIFKAEGEIIEQILTKDVKNINIDTLYDEGHYIKYGDTYVSLTRINYPESYAETLPFAFAGQNVPSFINNIVIQITGITIYESIVYQNDCILMGRSINNFIERSDLSIFSLPKYSISGATKIMTGTTVTSNGVYIVDTLSSLTFNVIYTADSIFNFYFVNNNGINFDLYQRNTPTNITIGTLSNPYEIIPIINNPIFSSNKLYPTNFKNITNFKSLPTIYSSTTLTYDLSNFEGEFVIKGLYSWTDFTYFSNLIQTGHQEYNNFGAYPYNLYNDERDYYFVYLKRADKPKIFSEVNISDLGPLNVIKIIPSCDGQSLFPMPQLGGLVSTTSILVAVNGVVLSTSEYLYSGTTLSILSGYILTTDIITVALSNPINSPSLYTESYKIVSIPNTSYPSYGQKVIFNTGTTKYEYWLDYETINDPVLSVNGQILNNNIDFYVSSSEKRRLIFENSLYINDIVTVYYNSVMNNAYLIDSKVFSVSWSITTPPKNNLGYFKIELTNKGDNSFNSPIFTGITFYNTNQTTYTADLYITGGTYNQKLILRVTNYKNYYTVLNELLQTINVSDITPLTINTNALNNY